MKKTLEFNMSRLSSATRAAVTSRTSTKSSVMAVALTLCLSSILAACGSGGGGQAGDGAANGVVNSITATTLPGAVTQISAMFPNTVPQSLSSQLSEYSMTQEQAFPTGGSANSLFNGAWFESYNLNGECYIVSGQPYDENCGKAGAPSSPIGQITFSGVMPSVENEGGFQATDLTNGGTEQGNYKVYYGLSMPQAAGTGDANEYLANIAIVVFGDVMHDGAYQYSGMQTFIGTAMVEYDGKTVSFVCPSQGSTFSFDHTYTLEVLQPLGPEAPGNGTEFDYAAIFTPDSSQGGVPSATNCISSTNSTSSIGSSPTISSVSTVGAAQTQQITISGSGFGSMSPYDGDSCCIEFNDTSDGDWAAGYIKSGVANDTVTLNVTSWTNSQIIITGFTGAYGGVYVLHQGDQFKFTVWNPTSGISAQYSGQVQ